MYQMVQAMNGTGQEEAAMRKRDVNGHRREPGPRGGDLRVVGRRIDLAPVVADRVVRARAAR